jgi:CubicO group peptidase (beta-lactamase class C family)
MRSLQTQSFVENPMRKSIAALFLVFIFAFIAHAQLSQATKDAIDKLATETLTKTGVPSASIAVVKDGQVVYVKAYGDARLEPRTAATAEMPLQHWVDQ